MNLLLFYPQERTGNDSVVITDHRLTHLNTVLGSQVGDRVQVGEVGGEIGAGEVIEIDDSSATLAITLNQPPPEKLPLTLVLALPRPKMLRRILRTIAEMGVYRLLLINSYRVEKSYWQTPALEPTAIEQYFLEGLAQSRDTVLPAISCHKRFKPFVEDELPALCASCEATLLHPGDAGQFQSDGTREALLVVGPEGGFIPYEVDKLIDAGCSPASLGPRILRVENAVTTALGRFLF